MQNSEWVRQPQETGGSYMFAGKMYCTSGIERNVPKDVINRICHDVLQFAKEQNGIDYLVVYKHRDTGQKLFFIDQITKEEAASGDFQKAEHYCTLLLASEY